MGSRLHWLKPKLLVALGCLALACSPGPQGGSGGSMHADATDLDAEVGLTDADAVIPDAIADVADTVGDSDISLDSGPDAAEVDLADLGTVLDLDGAGNGGSDVDDLDADADTDVVLSDTAAAVDAHFDSKYPDVPSDAIEDVVDTADAGPSETFSETDGSGKDCPPWGGSGAGLGVFCTATECCLSPMTVGPCGWITCCSVPEIKSKWNTGESCSSVPEKPPYITYGPCPAILKYETDLLLPVCNPECWCS